MSYRFGRDNFNPMSRMSGASAVKVLIIANVALYVLKLIFQIMGPAQSRFFVETFGLVPELITSRFYLWQFVTAMFLHGDFFHILFTHFETF